MTRSKSATAGVWVLVGRSHYWITRNSSGHLVVFGGDDLAAYPESVQSAAIVAAKELGI